MRFFWPILCVGTVVAVLDGTVLLAEARKRKEKTKAKAEEQQKQGIEKIRFTQEVFKAKKNAISAMPNNSRKWEALLSEMLSLGSTKVRKVTGGGKKCLKAAAPKSFVYSNVPTFRSDVDVRVVLVPIGSVKIESETRLLLEAKCMNNPLTIQIENLNESETNQFREYCALLGKKGDVRQLDDKELNPGKSLAAAQALVSSLYGLAGGDKVKPVIFVAAETTSREPGKLDITGNVETFVAAPCGTHSRNYVCVPGVLRGSGQSKKKAKA